MFSSISKRAILDDMIMLGSAWSNLINGEITCLYGFLFSW